MNGAARFSAVCCALGAALLASCVSQAPIPEPATPPAVQPSKRAEVLILGDSQLSFGLGQALTVFFRSAGARCDGLNPRWQSPRAAAIGVRSTALHHWTAVSDADKAPICDVDERYGVNASSFGVVGKGLTFVQIGQDPAHPFCRSGASVMSQVFETKGFDPDLVVLAFLGNATQRWQVKSHTDADVRNAISEIPQGTSCIVMTTVPTFEAEQNDLRETAQSNLRRAVKADGRCVFVAGITPRIRAEIEGQTGYFKTNAAGVVVDPSHPTPQSAQRFVELQTPALCAALSSEID